MAKKTCLPLTKESGFSRRCAVAIGGNDGGEGQKLFD
jgi:hypothetical protein